MLRISALALAALIAIPAVSAQAQKTVQTGVGGGGSPHVTTTWTIEGANLSISYGRPYLKGRADSVLMPVGKPWRTGADEATVLTTDKPLTFGTVKLAPGTYTINTQPGTSDWQLIVGKLEKAGQWGVPYLPNLEIGRAPMKLGRPSSPVEQVTYSIDHAGNTHTLRIEFGNKSATIPFTVGK